MSKAGIQILPLFFFMTVGTVVCAQPSFTAQISSPDFEGFNKLGELRRYYKQLKKDSLSLWKEQTKYCKAELEKIDEVQRVRTNQAILQEKTRQVDSQMADAKERLEHARSTYKQAETEWDSLDARKQSYLDSAENAKGKIKNYHWDSLEWVTLTNYASGYLKYDQHYIKRIHQLNPEYLDWGRVKEDTALHNVAKNRLESYANSELQNYAGSELDQAELTTETLFPTTEISNVAPDQLDRLKTRLLANDVFEQQSDQIREMRNQILNFKAEDELRGILSTTEVNEEPSGLFGLEKWRFGGSVHLNVGTTNYIDIQPSIGYQITHNWVLGGSYSDRVILTSSFPYMEADSVGTRSLAGYSHYRIYKSLHMYAEVSESSRLNSALERPNRFSETNLLLGLRKTIKIRNSWNATVDLLYNFNHDKKVVEDKPLVVRFGFYYQKEKK